MQTIGAPYSLVDEVSNSDLSSYALKDGTNFTNPTTWLTGLGMGDITFTNSGRTQTFAAGNVDFTLASNGHFRINTSGTGMVGINTTTPVCALHVSTSLTTSPRGIMSAQYSTGTDGARIHMRKARGTEAAPTVVVTGDDLGRIQWSGYDGNSYEEMASIRAAATGTIADTRVPTQLIFSTATDAAPSVLTDRMWLTTAGQLQLGVGSTTVPSFAFNGDPTTGFYSPSAGLLRIQSVAGTSFDFGSDFVVNNNASTIRFGDVTLGRATTATWRLGAASSASPVSQTLTVQGSRGGTDSDVSGGNFTIQSGLGTGSSAGSAIIFKTPDVQASGTTQQSATERVRILGTGAVGIGTTVPGAFGLAVNHSTGQALSLIYNDSDGSPSNYANLTVSSGGNLTIAPSGLTTILSGVTQSSRTGLNGVGAASVVLIMSDGKTVNDSITLPFQLQNSSSAAKTYGQIRVAIDDPTAASEDGSIYFTGLSVGASVNFATFSGLLTTLPNDLTLIGTGVMTAVKFVGGVQSLSGAGAVNVTQAITEVTTTGAAQALTLADGVAGQEKTIVHGVDGGSFVLTPTTKTGWSTFTSTAAGESITLVFLATRGWCVKGSYLGVIAP